MKELYLVRHAKSDWASDLLKDIDRPLSERGYSDAYFMSKWFLKNHKKPEIILSSTATRALNTALIFARTFEFNMDNFFLNEKIYESTVPNLITILNKQKAEINSIMVFCHNPAITNLCNNLNDDVFIDNVPTCGLVNLNFAIDNWKSLGERKGNLGFFQFPKDFKNSN